MTGVLCRRTQSDLDRLVAWDRVVPARSARVLDVKVACTAMDREWKETIDANHWWARGFKGDLAKEYPAAIARDKAAVRHFLDGEQKRLLRLRDMLVGQGGEEACIALQEPELEELLERGQFWPGTRLRSIARTQSRCHENSAGVWLANQESVVLATGYALSSDGIWRSHSFLVQPMPRSAPYILETTRRRLLYFGVAFDYEAALAFARENGLDVDARAVANERPMAAGVR
jgi:hypothetical protein